MKNAEVFVDIDLESIGQNMGTDVLDTPPADRLYVLQFQQTKLGAKIFGHWVLLYVHGDQGTVFHITKNANETFQFESSARLTRHWTDHQLSTACIFVGTTDKSREQIEAVCQQVADKFRFDSVWNNCQNYIAACLEELGLDTVVHPFNRCTCYSDAMRMSSPRPSRRCQK